MKQELWQYNVKSISKRYTFDLKAPNFNQWSQATWGKGQGGWGKYAPKAVPMQYRKKAK